MGHDLALLWRFRPLELARYKFSYLLTWYLLAVPHGQWLKWAETQHNGSLGPQIFQDRSETAFLLILAEMLVGDLLCWGSQGQLSIFVVSYTLQSFLMKYRWDRNRLIGSPNWVAGPSGHIEFPGPEMCTLDTVCRG